jgi:cytochrome P450
VARQLTPMDPDPAPAVTAIDELDLPYLDFVDPTVACNPFESVRRLATNSWALRTPVGYLLTRLSDCVSVSKDRRFVTPDDLGLRAQGVTSPTVLRWAAGALLAQNGDVHRRIRRLAQPAFTPQRIDSLRRWVVELVGEVFDRVIDDGAAEVAALNDEIVVRTICRVLGFEESNWKQIAEWADAINQVISVSAGEQVERIEQAIERLDVYTAAAIDRLQRSPDGSLGSALIAAHEAGDRLSEDELVALFQTLLMAGAETTRNTLSSALFLFARHPEQWALLGAREDLVAAATEEVLRFRPPFIGTARLVTEDVVLHDTLLPSGTQLLLGLPGANFDEAVFAAPDDFDITRFEQSVVNPGHVSFGAGFHFCLGAPLARIEIQEVLRYLAPRLRSLRADDSIDDWVAWSPPFGVHGPVRLCLTWDPAAPEWKVAT